MKSAVIIGSGNVATQLGREIYKAGVNIVQVYGRSGSHVCQLASLVGASPVVDPREIYRGADFYLIAVADSAIPGVVELLPRLEGLVAHTAGSINLIPLQKFSLHGVLYPYQTISKNVELDWSQVPLLIEGNSRLATGMLMELATKLSDKVLEMSSDSRLILHVGAVFACNFVNHLYALAQQLFEQHDIDFSLLRPLILETTNKALSMNPRLAQTGPARRIDQDTICRHMELLQSNPSTVNIYKLLTRSVQEMYEV